ncbi:MAG: amidohydrolase, partial [Bacteroidia bacterium]|nr:amidohydrolase [Bacteroidia bacterium]
DQKWVLARGWDHTRWHSGNLPDKEALDQQFPTTPVYLERIDLHAAIVNQAALDLAAISLDTHLEGGEIHQKNGKLTGILVDKAMDLVRSVIPPLPEEEIEGRLLFAQSQLFKVGVTSFTDALLTQEQYDRLIRLEKAGKWKLRVFGYMPADRLHLERWLDQEPDKEGRVRFCGVKTFADGALGSRGAWLKEPYSDGEGTGLNLLEGTGYEALVKRVADSPWQMMTHVIGDAASEYVTDVWVGIQDQLEANSRWRLEHLQMLTKKVKKNLDTLTVVISIQPTHATSDASWVEKRVGVERMKNIYPLKFFLDSGLPVALGTDVPVESPDPLKTLYSAVFRVPEEGRESPAIRIEEALTHAEALHGMTFVPAYSVKAEKELGTLSEGFFSDFVVLGVNPLIISKESPLCNIVLETLVEGQIVFRSGID